MMATDREGQLLLDATQAGITSPKELANFMAQVSAESQGLNRLEEGFRYTRGISQIPVKYAHREGDQPLEAARVEALQGKPEKLAELMYGGRMGNDEHGDGYTYRGRGYMQLTGKENYAAAGKALGLDLVKNPDLASTPENASKIATWYWENRVPEKAHGDVKAATLAINGGYNGLDTRQAQFEKWEKTLTPDVMERLAKNDVGLPIEATNAGRHAARTASVGHHSQGDNSVAVRQLQTDLSHLGYTGANGKPLKADGDFGPATQTAVEAFQRDHHLAVDGKAGPKTLEVLHTQTQSHAKASLPGLENPKNPDHALYEQALAGVRQLDAQAGRASDQHSANLAAAVVVEAKKAGMTRIDHVALSTDGGTRVFAVQSDASVHKYADVPTLPSLNTPIEKSSAALQQMNQQQSQHPPTALQAPAQAQPAPAMSR
jgi:putative chitinase